MYVDVLYYICKNKCNSYRPICTVLVFLLRLCKTIKNISFGGGGGWSLARQIWPYNDPSVTFSLWPIEEKAVVKNHVTFIFLITLLLNCQWLEYKSEHRTSWFMLINLALCSQGHGFCFLTLSSWQMYLYFMGFLSIIFRQVFDISSKHSTTIPSRFLDSVAKLRKGTVSFSFLSVCPSALNNLGSHLTDFHEI